MGILKKSADFEVKQENFIINFDDLQSEKAVTICGQRKFEK